MTEHAGLAAITAAAALFCVTVTGLALQMAAGRDPALGASSEGQARPVVVRRVEVRRVVTLPPRGAAAPAGVAAPAAPSAPAAAAPAAAPPAAPAPAPAVSRAS